MKKLKVNIIPYETVRINEIVIKYGRLPSELIPGHTGMTFYFETRDAYTADKHENAIVSLIKDIIDASFDHGVYWDLVKVEAAVWEENKQITVASFRVRDSY